MKQLYENINYKSGIPFAFSRFIREYDIKKANISILYENNVISKSIYEWLYNAERLERQKYIGVLQLKDPNIITILQDGIIEAKRKLFKFNNIEIQDVLCIKNDAVFIFDKILKTTKFDNIEFIMKNEYTSYLNLFNIEFYYAYDKITKNEKCDIKGIGKSAHFHMDYMAEFIFYIINEIQTEDIETVIGDFNNFYRQYQEKNLPIQYYREFNSDSLYSIINSTYKVSTLRDDKVSKECVDGSYNNNMLRLLYQYITTIYFNKK